MDLRGGNPEAPSGLTLPDLAGRGVGLALLAAGASVAMLGPDTPIPIHYNLAGEADNWAGRGAVGALLAVQGALALAVALGMGRAAARAADAARARSLRAGQWVAAASFGGVGLLILWPVLGGGASMAAAAPMALLGLIFTALGAVLGRVGPNPVIGVRTPWAYKSRLAWERSNRLAGRLYFAIGLLALAGAAFAPQPAGFVAVLGAVLAASVWAVVESWRVWRADPDRQPF